jgi:hypothetical protein
MQHSTEGISKKEYTLQPLAVARLLLPLKEAANAE